MVERDEVSRTLSIGATARILLDAGFKPVLLQAGTKRPAHQAWEAMHYDQESIADFDSPNVGLGLRWGEGYIDIDLENQTVAAVGAVLLPTTTMVWGRPGIEASHRVYKVQAPGYKTLKVKDHNKTLFAELRHHHSQSVVPPSRHPETGGYYRWSSDGGGTPAQRSSGTWASDVEYAVSNVPELDVTELEITVKETVFTAAMAELWPMISGSRHDAMMGICGMLLKTGRPLDRVLAIARLVVDLGQDPDPEDRLQIPGSSAQRLEEGQDIAGYTLLEQTLGVEVAKWAAKMFHVPVEKVESIGGITLNDLGNSELFCHLFGDDLMYLPFKKDWCNWNGSYWEIVNNNSLEQTRAKQTVKHMELLAPTLGTAAERGAMRQHALHSGDATAIAAMVKLSRDSLIIDEASLDTDPWLFNCRNGTLNLATGVLLPHRRQDRITRMGGVEYDHRAECPQWMGFLRTVFDGDEELVEFAQRMAGYCMTGSVAEQCLFFLYGHGKNGKTTFIEVLTALYGSYAVRTPAETLVKKKEAGIPNDVARLRGARFVASKEVEAGTRLAENVVKDLTGGDTVTARFLHGEWFDFRPVMKLLMYGNHKPTVHGQDEGIWRRIRLIPFSVTIADGIKVDDYASKLVKEEGPGILRWAVEGCMKWQGKHSTSDSGVSNDGVEGSGLSRSTVFAPGGLLTPGVVAEATQEYRGEMDVFGEFFSTYYRPKSGAKMLMDAVYSTYSGWCVTTGERQVSQRALNSKLVEKGYDKLKSNGRWYLTGFQALGDAVAEAAQVVEDALEVGSVGGEYKD